MGGLESKIEIIFVEWFTNGDTIFNYIGDNYSDLNAEKIVEFSLLLNQVASSVNIQHITLSYLHKLKTDYSLHQISFLSSSTAIFS